jgi:hypothetical protein
VGKSSKIIKIIMSSTQESGYVYFITQKNQVTSPGHRCGWRQLVKIGKTKNQPTRRLLQAEQAFPNKTWLSGSFKVEKAIYVENMTEVEELIHLRFEEYHEYEKGYGTEWYVYFPEKVDILLKFLLNGSKTNHLWSEVEEVPEEVLEEVGEVPGETKETELCVKKKRKKRIVNPFSEEDQETFKTQAKISPIRRDIWQKFVRDVNQNGKFRKNTTFRPPKNVEYTGGRMGLAGAMIWQRDNM